MIIDIAFMCDILVNFNTGFYKKGYLVMKRKEIIKNYVKTWFFLDLLASFLTLGSLMKRRPMIITLS